MFTIEARIVEVRPERKGVSQSGNAWVVREYIGEYLEGDKWIRFVFTTFGENIAPLAIGKTYVLQLKIEGREWNGKWFNNVVATQVFTASTAQSNAPQATQGGEAGKPMPQKPDAILDKDGKVKPTTEEGGKKDDINADGLPF